ncbi:MAG: hypothetical protein OXQ29_06545 [Rhodospirillaceae bacterium]|nr:hypothetical protein [Rhodospirillaceae bacterium]
MNHWQRKRWLLDLLRESVALSHQSAWLQWRHQWDMSYRTFQSDWRWAKEHWLKSVRELLDVEDLLQETIVLYQQALMNAFEDRHMMAVSRLLKDRAEILGLAAGATEDLSMQMLRRIWDRTPAPAERTPTLFQQETTNG